jgi:anaerobic magnesium-protoporphyrin IX monomethyl ester cyclase
MKILLVVPRHRSTHNVFHCVNYLAATLLDKPLLRKIAAHSAFPLPAEPPDFEIKVLDLNAVPATFRFSNYVKRFGPALVGVTATTPTFGQAADIAKALKLFAPNALRIIGGYHSTALPLETLQSTQFQIAAIGYGEETLSELAMCLAHNGRQELIAQLAALPGIAYKDRQGKIHQNPRRAEYLPLDDLPFPHLAFPFYDYLGPEHETQNGDRHAFIIGARGCPFSCKYCSGEVMHEGQVRRRSLENIFREIEELISQGINYFHFDEESFTVRPDLSELLTGLRRFKERDPRFKFGMETRLDHLNEEQIDQLAAAGLASFAFGLESGDEALARDLKNDPRLSLPRIIELTAAAKARGISVAYNLLVGFPRQGWQSVFKTALLLRHHPPDRAGVSTYSFYPGSEYYRTLLQEGIARVTGYDGVLRRIEMNFLTQGEIRSALADLELLIYYMMCSLRSTGQDLEAAQMLAEAALDKLRVATIYDLLITSRQHRDDRNQIINRVKNSADPLWRSLIDERPRENVTFLGLLGKAEKIPFFVAAWLDKYRRAINLRADMKEAHLDPFLANIWFANAYYLTRLPFSVIRLFIITCAVMHARFPAKPLKTIQIEDDQWLAEQLKKNLTGKAAKDINEAQLSFNDEALERGDLVTFLGLQFRYDAATDSLVFPKETA